MQGATGKLLAVGQLGKETSHSKRVVQVPVASGACTREGVQKYKTVQYSKVCNISVSISLGSSDKFVWTEPAGKTPHPDGCELREKTGELP